MTVSDVTIFEDIGIGTTVFVLMSGIFILLPVEYNPTPIVIGCVIGIFISMVIRKWT